MAEFKRSINFANSRSRRAAGAAVVVLWASLTAYGLGHLWMYQATPGERYPAPAAIGETSGQFRLFVFLHPKCSCSRASVAELAKLMTQSDNHVDAHVLFTAQQCDDGSVERSSLWTAAAAIPGVKVEFDRDGELAKQYGAATSGHVVLYRPDGSLAFSGGITASRGHEGDNVGLTSILSIVAGRRVTQAETPVFGCALSDAATLKNDQLLPSDNGGR